jgi:hypothetical protein
MYFLVSYTLSPTILHILPQHFTIVSPLDRQLNTICFLFNFQRYIVRWGYLFYVFQKNSEFFLIF